MLECIEPSINKKVTLYIKKKFKFLTHPAYKRKKRSATKNKKTVKIRDSEYSVPHKPMWETPKSQSSGFQVQAEQILDIGFRQSQLNFVWDTFFFFFFCLISLWMLWDNSTMPPPSLSSSLKWKKSKGHKLFVQILYVTAKCSVGQRSKFYIFTYCTWRLCKFFKFLRGTMYTLEDVNHLGTLCCTETCACWSIDDRFI